MTKLTDDDVRNAYADYMSKEFIECVAARYGVHRRTLWLRFTKLSLPLRSRTGVARVRLTREQLIEAIGRRKKNEPLDDIAYDLKIAPVTLSRRLREAGHDTRRKCRPAFARQHKGEQYHAHQRTA